MSQADFAWNPTFIYSVSHFFLFHIYLPFLQPLTSYIWAISILNVFFRTNSRKCFSEIESSYHVVFRVLISSAFSPPLSLIMLFLTKSNKRKLHSEKYSVKVTFLWAWDFTLWCGLVLQLSQHSEFPISWNSACLPSSKDTWGKSHFCSC